MQLFSVDATMFPKRCIFFCPWKQEKTAPKVVYNRTIFFQYWPGCPNGPKTEIPYHQKPFNAGIRTGYLD